MASALGAILALALVEVVGRIEGPQVCLDDWGALLRADPEVGWTYRPDLEVTVAPCRPTRAKGAWSAPLATNAEGLPDQQWPTEKRPGEVRVLLLGDERADGVGLARADRLSVKLAQLSDQARGARVSAINALIPGYAPADALRWLRRRGLRYRPDVVVLLLDAGHDLAAGLLRARARPLAPALPPATGLLAWSGGLRWLAARPEGSRLDAVRPLEPRRPRNEDELRLARRRTAEAVAAIARASHEAEAAFALAIAPPCPPRPYPADLCEALAGSAPCLDLGPTFEELRRAAPAAELCIPGAGRWGRDAHFLASHKLWDFLAEQRLWPPTVVRGYRL